MSWIAKLPHENPTSVCPAASDFPAQPATWYLFCHSSELRNRPLSKRLLGRRLVAFRGTNGKFAVLDAHCAHLAADLGRGRVQGNCIQCPFHHWSFAQNGQCVSLGRPGNVPGSARLRSYPCEERHGFIYFFNGPSPLFPLPFFPDCEPNDFVASHPFSFSMDCPWYMVVCNGFDGQHFDSVHDRKLLAPPHIDCPTKFSRRLSFEAEVLGTSIFDRLLRRFAGTRVSVSITSCGGPYVMVEGRFGRAHSRLLVACDPDGDHRTVSSVLVFARKSRIALFDRLSLKVRRRFTQAFLQYDIDKLSGVRYQPEGLTEHDMGLVRYFQWASSLPRSEYEELPR